MRQQLIASNLWNDGAKIMKSFETCKKSRHFFSILSQIYFDFPQITLIYADFFIPQRYILPLIALIYADIFSCRYSLADCADFLFNSIIGKVALSRFLFILSKTAPLFLSVLSNFSTLFLSVLSK